MSEPQGPPGYSNMAVKDLSVYTFPKGPEKASFLGKGKGVNIWNCSLSLVGARLCHPFEELTFTQAIRHRVAGRILGPPGLCCFSLLPSAFTKRLIACPAPCWAL